MSVPVDVDEHLRTLTLCLSGERGTTPVGVDTTLVELGEQCVQLGKASPILPSQPGACSRGE